MVQTCPSCNITLPCEFRIVEPLASAYERLGGRVKQSLSKDSRRPRLVTPVEVEEQSPKYQEAYFKSQICERRERRCGQDERLCGSVQELWRPKGYMLCRGTYRWSTNSPSANTTRTTPTLCSREIEAHGRLGFPRSPHRVRHIGRRGERRSFTRAVPGVRKDGESPQRYYRTLLLGGELPRGGGERWQPPTMYHAFFFLFMVENRGEPALG